jgi:protein-tyrosine kinase
MSTIEKALAKKNISSEKVKENEAAAEISTKQDVEKTSSTTVSSSLKIDKESLRNRGYLVDSDSRNSIKEEFRQIKRKLLNNAFGKASNMLRNSNLIMVSSAKPNEGKTFVSINLALSVALEQDKTVLLVDSDVLRPSVARELGIENTNGLMEYLLDESVEVSDVLYNTNIDKLKLIPAGMPHHLSNELLASERMISLAQELAERYPDRIVIFDCPPLIGVSETLVLANLMGQALLVVEESKTPLANITEATANLNEDLALGIVVNKAIRSHTDMYGYYGYGYETK